MFRQEHFIKSSIGNVFEALRDGAILVVIVLILFLMNVRTTIVTLTALPLSIITTFLVFHWLDLSVNTMTLGGLAVAIGELVDDAVVDVENVYRRLGENRRVATPSRLRRSSSTPPVKSATRSSSARSSSTWCSCRRSSSRASKVGSSRRSPLRTS